MISKFVKCSIEEIVMFVKERYFVWKCVWDDGKSIVRNDDSDDWKSGFVLLIWNKYNFISD